MVKPACDLDRLAGALVVQARAGDGVALAVQLDAAVVGEDARAVRGGAAGERPDGCHTSTDASATVNARLMPGFSRGSRRSASATSISSVGSPASAQPARNWSP